MLDDTLLRHDFSTVGFPARGWHAIVFPIDLTRTHQKYMVAWAGLDSSNGCIYVVNRHFSNSIIDMVFAGHS